MKSGCWLCGIKCKHGIREIFAQKKGNRNEEEQYWQLNLIYIYIFFFS